jgi:hypothetical protein
VFGRGGLDERWHYRGRPVTARARRHLASRGLQSSRNWRRAHSRPLGGYTSTLVPREAALLESSFMIGASVAVGARSTLGVELYHDTEQFAPVDSSTLLGYFSFGLTESLSLEFTLGAREADGFDSATFAGLRLSATIGR